MIIPLNTQKQRVIIMLDISVDYPLTLGIVVHDPLRPYTHYIRRKVPFIQGEENRKIGLSLPVTPNKVALDIYNKMTGDDDGFTIEKLFVDHLAPNDIWATPARHRFMDFSIEFAQKAGYVAPGFYPSKNYEFLIQYLPAITDEFGKELVTPARIHRMMPRVQLSQKLFKQFSIPVRVAILSHEGCHYFKNTRSEKEADLCGIKYYLDYGFPRIEAIYAATQVFLTHPKTVNEMHLKRTADIDEFVNNYKRRQEAV
jgi:hypothetical protein